jgi:hypothetical protein
VAQALPSKRKYYWTDGGDGLHYLPLVRMRALQSAIRVTSSDHNTIISYSGKWWISTVLIKGGEVVTSDDKIH